MLPWALYNLTPRDQASALIRPYSYRRTDTGAGVTDLSGVFPRVEDDYVLLVTAINIVLNSSAGGTANYVQLDVSPETNPTGPVHMFLHYKPGSDTKLSMAHGWYGSPLILVQPWHIVTARGNSTGGMVLGTMHSSISGVMIPRGTMAHS